MSDRKGIDYGRFMERAMRNVMAEVLGEVAEGGLPGEHHFYITFDTNHPGVDIAPWLKERYPDEMMVVLQEWFDDLGVMADRFRVTLNFSDTPETLVIPFDAVKTFIDPSVRFGLKFDDYDPDDRREFDATLPPAEVEPDDGAAPTAENEDDHESAEVVSLDTFRKH